MEMNDKFTIELDEAFLEEFYMHAGELPPAKEMATLEDFKRVLSKMKSVGVVAAPKEENFGFSAIQTGQEEKKVLIVDDLGTITYQLSILLSKNGYSTVCSNEIYDAIAKFKKQHFDIVIQDLFIPTDREGFLLLDELIKLNEYKMPRSTIGIMTASNKKEYKIACKERGADFYVEKVDTWQKNVIDMCQRLNEI
ncbi:response regulator [bacterium]|nr:response regulator [bacterium]